MNEKIEFLTFFILIYIYHYNAKGEGDNKIIIEANTKATADNSIPPMVAK